MFVLDDAQRFATAPTYVMSAEELAWAAALTAVTMAIHGVGMNLTLHLGSAIKDRFQKRFSAFAVGLGGLIFASWLILLIHLLEVLVWAAFFLWKADLPNASVAYTLALLDYTTVGSATSLPLRWHLLEGVVAIAGMLTFAWSTGVLLMLARELQDDQLLRIERRRNGRRPPGAAPPVPQPPKGA